MSASGNLQPRKTLHEPSTQIRMTNDEIRRNTEIRMTNPATAHQRAVRHSGFGFLSSFDLRHSSFDSRFMVPMHSEKRKRSFHEPGSAGIPAGVFSRKSRRRGRRRSQCGNRFMVPKHARTAEGAFHEPWLVWSLE
jgi:hypothetical protein